MVPHFHIVHKYYKIAIALCQLRKSCEVGSPAFKRSRQRAVGKPWRGSSQLPLLAWVAKAKMAAL
ncbi:MAG: hypothetical protein V7L21_23305 [Nostoc sp.]|uniref:hypothetical protein n=1 Tax=Nostoc sp. NMS9 TaxID=2815393 RepID=UPI0025F007B4|nr:hypothetical protein [Nostoc sp. NMS9]